MEKQGGPLASLAMSKKRRVESAAEAPAAPALLTLCAAAVRTRLNDPAEGGRLAVASHRPQADKLAAVLTGVATRQENATVLLVGRRCASPMRFKR